MSLYESDRVGGFSRALSRSLAEGLLVRVAALGLGPGRVRGAVRDVPRGRRREMLGVALAERAPDLLRDCRFLPGALADFFGERGGEEEEEEEEVDDDAGKGRGQRVSLERLRTPVTSAFFFFFFLVCFCSFQSAPATSPAGGRPATGTGPTRPTTAAAATPEEDAEDAEG